MPEAHSGNEESPKASLGSKATSWAWLIAVAGILSYLIFFRGSSERAALQAAAPGWQELALCSETISLDQKKTLHLYDDGRAVFDELSKEGEDEKSQSVDGEWNYDEASRKYVVKLNDAAIAYSMVSLDDAMICMLIKGDIGAADLRASWFSSVFSVYNDEHEVQSDRF